MRNINELYVHWIPDVELLYSDLIVLAFMEAPWNIWIRPSNDRWQYMLNMSKCETYDFDTSREKKQNKFQ